jgi:type IX secretion system PorP/SprF family membrane protein
MRKIKSSIVLLMALLATSVAYGQQKPQYTMYMINPFLVNPAVSGTEDYTDIRAGYRNQWTGFEGAPKTFFLSAHTNIGKHHVTNNRSRNKKNGFHGLGVVFTNDAIGPSVSTVGTLAYSYHLKLAKKWFASVGLSGGIQQFALDASKLTTTVQGDQSVVSFTNSSLADLNAGFWIYSDKMYFGGSMAQIFPQKMFNASTNAVADGKLAQHYFFTAGYRIPLGYDFTLVPSFVVKAVYPAPVTFDINAKVRYQDLVWAGISYRRTDAVAFMVGVIIKETFDIAYSYDYTTNPLRQYSSGSHEIIIGYRLRTKGQLVCPSNYW